MAIRNLSDGSITGDVAFDEKVSVPVNFTGAFNVPGFIDFSRVGNMGYIRINPISGTTSGAGYNYLNATFPFPPGFSPVNSPLIYEFGMINIPYMQNKTIGFDGHITVIKASGTGNASVSLNGVPTAGGIDFEYQLNMAIPYICA